MFTNYEKYFTYCRIDNKTSVVVMEKICSIVCFVAGTIFLLIALFGAWKYFLTMGICYAAGILVSEDADNRS